MHPVFSGCLLFLGQLQIATLLPRPSQYVRVLRKCLKSKCCSFPLPFLAWLSGIALSAPSVFKTQIKDFKGKDRMSEVRCERIVTVNIPIDGGIIVSESLPNEPSEILRINEGLGW